jgi:hypothetical protein
VIADAALVVHSIREDLTSSLAPEAIEPELRKLLALGPRREEHTDPGQGSEVGKQMVVGDIVLEVSPQEPSLQAK